jgi:hypothetical protein
MATILELACDPAIVGCSTMTVTLLPEKVRRPLKLVWKPLPDEAELGLREWCAARGIPVPAEELQGLRDGREAEAEAEAAIVAKVAVTTIELKPEFGTPEFWTWARKRRNEKNAERAAAGLPPLLTTAQKAAVKAAKAAQAK